MATALLATVIDEYITRKNYLTNEISNLQDQKYLLMLSQNDTQADLAARKSDCKSRWIEIYENDEDLQQEYDVYTDIPEFQEEMDKITSEMDAIINDLTAKESVLEAQITTDDTELKEIEAYIDSYKEMLSGNISEDYDFGLGS